MNLYILANNIGIKRIYNNTKDVHVCIPKATITAKIAQSLYISLSFPGFNINNANESNEKEIARPARIRIS